MDKVRTPDPAPGGLAARSWLRWRPRAVLAPEDRQRILADLYPEAGRAGRWWFRFTVMLALSVVIAVLGLSLDSDAVIIGAMLIAPLMTPIIGTAAALVMGWPRRLGQAGLAVLAGAAGAVGISFAVTYVLPATSQVLTPAVLSRTSPDLRDLAVALAAGAAGAYATAREDVSAALPGVAVAVALVPPLAATGFTLAIGREDLASGAVLLFTANLVAIVLIGSVVLVASGFVPSGRLKAASGRIRAGFVAAAAAAVAVAAPLTATTLANASHARTTQAVNQAAVSWLAGDPALTLTGTSISGPLVTIDVTGATSPPPTTSLAKALTAVLGPGAAVEVRWYQTHLGRCRSPRSIIPADIGTDPVPDSILAGRRRRRSQRSADCPAHPQRGCGQRGAGRRISPAARPPARPGDQQARRTGGHRLGDLADQPRSCRPDRGSIHRESRQRRRAGPCRRHQVARLPPRP